MNFKEKKIRDEFWQIDPRLRQILCDIEVLAYPEYMTITCIMRTEEENKAVRAKTLIHCVGRAADIRPFKSETTNAMLLELINQLYVYDVNRPNLKTLYRHVGTGDHLHVQVRPIDEVVKGQGRLVV
jgi:hypothetical protein